jgi:drug/metabolite transporter (DMT)-like permease
MVSDTATTSLSDRRAALAGIGLMTAGIFLFAVNDALGKWLVATYSVGQVLLIRSIAALFLLTPFIWRDRATFAQAPRWGMQALRAFLATAEVGCFYWAVTYLPLADVMAYYLAGPIFVTAIAGAFLGEQIGWRRWSAVAVGFLGVIVCLRPGSAALSWPALIALLGSFTFSLSMICVNRSLKLAPASTVVPYQYTTIVWAVLFGYAVFGDVPDVFMLTGAAIIIGAGLFIFLRERRLARRASFSEPPP